MIRCSERVKKLRKSSGKVSPDQLRLSGLVDICLNPPISGNSPPLVHLAIGPWTPVIPLVLSALSSLYSLSLLHRFQPALSLAGWQTHLPAEAKAAVLSIKIPSEKISGMEFQSPRNTGRWIETGILILNGGPTWEQSFGHPFETMELLDTLRGKGPLVLTKLTMEIGAEIFLRGGICSSLREARYLIRKALLSGRAAVAFSEFVAARGIDSFDSLREAASLHHGTVLHSPQKGCLSSVDTNGIRHKISKAEGSGRNISLRLLKTDRDFVEHDAPLADILSAGPGDYKVEADEFSDFLIIGSDPLPYSPLVLERMDTRTAP